MSLQPVTLPDVGATTEPIRMAGWLVECGERVLTGDRLVEVLAQGVLFEVNSPCDGRLEKIEKRPPAEVQVGEVLAWIENVTTESELPAK